MSTARSVMLEIKRRLGDVNASVPGETDLLAFLNRALRGMWNYGTNLKSPSIQKTIHLTEATGNSVIVDEGVGALLAVRDNTLGRFLPQTDLTDALDRDIRGGDRRYVATGNVIELFPSDTNGVDLTLVYIPEFLPMEDRDDFLPFPSLLDDVIAEWVVALLTKKTSTVSDVEPALIQHRNTLNEYFRGLSRRLPTGRCPW